MKIIELAIKDKPQEDEALRLIIHAGILPDGAVINVNDSEGNRLGGVSPYGIFPGQKAGAHTIAIPTSMATKEKMKLHITIDDNGERAPTNEELKKLELVIIKADNFNEKGNL